MYQNIDMLLYQLYKERLSIPQNMVELFEWESTVKLIKRTPYKGNRVANYIPLI